MNFEISKTSNPHRLLLSLLDKINLKRSHKLLLYQSLASILYLSNLSIYLYFEYI